MFLAMFKFFYNHRNFFLESRACVKSGARLFFCLLILFSLSVGCEARRDGLLTVTKVFDGDTVLLSDGEKVRLIGIDCPEAYESEKLFRDARRTHRDVALIQAQGRQAKEVAVRLVRGKRVILEYDLERRDRYGRLLAYVYIPLAQPHIPQAPSGLFVTERDGVSCIFMNAYLLEAGYAVPMMIPPNTRYADLFQSLHQKAREEKRGFWR